MELELLQEKIAKEEEEERMKLKYELQKKKDEEKRRVEEAELEDLKIKWRAEEERKKAAEKAAQQKAIDDWNKKKAEEEKEAKETRERVLRAEEQRKKDEKSEIERMKLVIALEEEKQKEREKEEHERWLLREKQKKEKEKAAKKAKDDELRNEMEKRLHKAGFQDNQIDAILDPKKAADLKPGQLPSNALQPIKTPTYIRVHKRYLDVETLKFYKLPYEYDLVSIKPRPSYWPAYQRHQENPDYIIILAELDVAQTDVLFEHTRRRRQRGTEYLIERGRTDKPEYAWVRKKKSPSRSPARGDRRRGSGLGFLF